MRAGEGEGAADAASTPVVKKTYEPVLGDKARPAARRRVAVDVRQTPQWLLCGLAAFLCACGGMRVRT